MALNLSHTDFNWGYGSVHDWRMEICRAENIQGDEADTFSMDTDDILYILMSHSDCDGIIKNADCGLLADRLEGILPKMEKRQNIHQEFIDALRECEACGDDLEFI